MRRSATRLRDVHKLIVAAHLSRARAVLVALAALTAASMGCARSGAPAREPSLRPAFAPLAACPRDASRDRSGRCACTEDTFSVLGACVPASVGDAFCGPGARVSDGGCTFQPCKAMEVLDIASGECVSTATLARGGASCGAPMVSIVEQGRIVCAPPDASCPRGTRLVGSTCARGLRCPPGTLADVGACRPIVFQRDGAASTQIDLAAFIALAVGVDGGLGSAALCRSLIQRPTLFGAPSGHPRSVRLRVRMTAPDQDLTRLRVDVTAQGNDGAVTSSVAAESAIGDAVNTLIEPLRGLGGESSVAASSVDVRCSLDVPERAVPLP